MLATFARLGSISSGTMRHEDLIPAFIDALDDLKQEMSFDNTIPEAERVAAVSRIDTMLGNIEQRLQEAEGYHDSGDTDADLEYLTEELESFAAPFTYFGPNEGDGADYGFWIDWNGIEDAIHGGEVVKVDSGLEWSPVALREHYGLSADTPLAILADRLEDDPEQEAVAEVVRALVDGASMVLESNDHGNAALFTPEGQEVWSCV